MSHLGVVGVESRSRMMRCSGDRWELLEPDLGFWTRLFLIDRFSNKELCVGLLRSRQKVIVDSNLFQDWGRIKEDGCCRMNRPSIGESRFINGERISSWPFSRA